MMASRRVLPRPDLRDLAARSNDLEPAGATWTAEGPGSLTPRLTLATDGTESGLAPAAFTASVCDFLRTAPAAWDPFAAR
jgi:hypothetical protein